MILNSEAKIWFLGRSYHEYLKMFSLNEEQLEKIKILDCAAGASSFTPYLHRKGCNITAVDIMYGKKAEDIKNQCEDDFQTLLELHSGLDHKVDWNFFKTPEYLVEQRISVYKEFITDYEEDNREIYVDGALPDLPFPENNFDLVLSSHLLFLYQERLGYDFHRKSVTEMLKISSNQVRIYPLLNLQGKGRISIYLSQLMDDLSDLADFEIVKVDYKFRRGGDEMLKITKT